MYSTPDEILAALDEYRAHIASENRRALEIYIPQITNAKEPDGDGSRCSPPSLDADRQRMDMLKHLIGDNTNVLDGAGVSSPAGLLERYDELAARLGLDGVFHHLPVRDADADDNDDDAPGERARRRRDEYFSAVEEGLRRECMDLEEVRSMISVPEEVRVLAGHVDGLRGPGLAYWRDMHQFSAWWGLMGEDAEDREAYGGRVKSPSTLAGWLGRSDDDDTGWTVGGGWDMGSGPDACLLAVYCRPGVREGGGAWGWRYFLLSEYAGGESVFETIPQLLAWHARFFRPDVSRFPDFDDSSIWDLEFRT